MYVYVYGVWRELWFKDQGPQYPGRRMSHKPVSCLHSDDVRRVLPRGPEGGGQDIGGSGERGVLYRVEVSLE